MALSNKQRVFIEEYLLCWNSSEAVRRSGYTGKPNVVGPRLLANVSISAEIEKRLREKHLSADEVLSRLADMARSDISEFCDIDTPSDLKKETLKGKTHVVKKFKKFVTKGRDGTEYINIELELYDAQAALLNIGKHHGLFVDKIEVKLEKEIDTILDVLESVLDVDSYQRALQALSTRIGNSETGTETAKTEEGENPT
jgi:phage terminase small subunit